MIKNYLVITLRSFLRHKNYTLINVFGLSIGITSCIIIFLLIRHDLSFDTFHSKAGRIYRVVHDSENASGIDYSGVTPYPFAEAFRNDFPDVPLVTQFHSQGETLVAVGGEKQMIDHVIFADSLFFEVFDFKVLSGNPVKDLGEPGKVFLTVSAAKKLLKNKTQGTIKLSNLVEAEVVGIIQDPPAGSHIQFSMIVSMPSLTKDFIGFEIDQWGLNSAGYSYIVLPKSISPAQIESRFKKFVTKYYEEQDEKRQTYRLQPLSKIHFDKRYNEAAVSISDLFMLGMLGIFILSIACINFINLATALAVKKSKEIGVRKTLGAKRSQLTYYFLSETLLITLFSVLLSLGLAEWILPWLNNFLDKQLSQSFFTDPILVVFLTLLTVFVTVCSGLYPATILSAFDPVAVLKNKLSGTKTAGGTVRKVLVVFQFLIAQALIIGTLIVADQMNYFRSKPLGFDKEAIVTIEMPENKPEVREAFRSRLEANSNILDVSFSVGAPISSSGIGTNFYLTDRGKDQLFDVNIKAADFHYLKTYGLQLIAGRWIQENEEKLASPPLTWEERKYVLVVNESAVKTLGFDNPEKILGRNVTVGLNDTSAPVIGVVKDFHTRSMHEKIRPVVLMSFPYFYAAAGIKIKSSNVPATISFIEKTWKEIHPAYYFRYEFLDDHITKLYRQEERTFSLFKIFSGISIFIGCLGLYGLISFMANQKLKEVGIRKVMGASVTSIVTLFSKEFVRLILIAFVVAIPLTWYGMNQWLNGFAYHVTIHWSVFAISVLVTLIIALLTVAYQSMKAALSNPVNTLRTE
jgi:putative ABC transport system permease protein